MTYSIDLGLIGQRAIDESLNVAPRIRRRWLVGKGSHHHITLFVIRQINFEEYLKREDSRLMTSSTGADRGRCLLPLPEVG